MYPPGEFALWLNSATATPLPLVRLAKKLKFSGWLELVYFIKFNITMPKLDVTNDIDYMSVQPEEALTPLLASLKQQRILIHGSGFSQLIAQYIYNKFLVTGVNASGAVARLRNPRTEKRRLLRLHLDHF